MTKIETAKLLAVLAAAFPRFEVDDMKVQVWYEMLGDLDYVTANMAVKKLILENTFAPSIAEVRKAAMEILNPDVMTAAEAWGEVERAVRTYGYYRGTEALASLPPRVAKVVRQFGWREICLNEEPGVVRGQFLKMYQQVQERDHREMLLPADLRQGIQRLAGMMDMKAIAGGGEP